MNPLILLGWIGVPTALTGFWLNSSSLSAADLEAKIGGMSARTVLAGGGLLGSFLLPPPLNLLGVGMLLGTVVSTDAIKKVTYGLNEIKMLEAEDNAQAAIPPVDSTSPREQRKAKRQGFFRDLYQRMAV
jgi:hypothetical protein